MRAELHFIYYDPEDNRIDGCGWNVMNDGGAIALRFTHADDAMSWCEENDVPYRVTTTSFY